MYKYKLGYLHIDNEEAGGVFFIFFGRTSVLMLSYKKNKKIKKN